MKKQNCAAKREGVRWRLESPKASSKFPPYKLRSDEGEVKRKVGEERDDDGNSEASDLKAKRRQKRKIEGENERKRATLP